jgi:hypothetical protein
MAPWEIWTFDFPVEGTHPCVIFSNAGRIGSPALSHVNVLICRTLRASLTRPMKPTEIVLDQADGLEWPTLCRVDALHLIPKAGLRERRGAVCKPRRRQISRQIMQLLPFEF